MHEHGPVDVQASGTAEAIGVDPGNVNVQLVRAQTSDQRRRGSNTIKTGVFNG